MDLSYLLTFPDGKYNIIYADPPWQYKDAGHLQKPGYDLMPLQDIKRLPVTTLAEDDCVLFMWAVSPMLPEAFEVIKAWGFEYKTVAFVWSKRTRDGNPRHNLGQWTMGNVEICLLATRGKIHSKRVNKAVKQLVEAERTTHSRKPDAVAHRIVDIFGDLPRVELFARRKMDGWDAWGNEL